MEIKVKRHKKIFCKTVVVLFIVFCLLLKLPFVKINPYISEMDIVFVPDSVPLIFNTDVLTKEINEYWVYRLNKEQQQLITQDISNGNWTKVTLAHINKIKNLECSLFRFEFDDSNEKYVCIYDSNTNKIITNSGNEIYIDTTEWIIFLYNTSTKMYYCIHQSI